MLPIGSLAIRAIATMEYLIAMLHVCIVGHWYGKQPVESKCNGMMKDRPSVNKRSD